MPQSPAWPPNGITTRPLAIANAPRWFSTTGSWFGGSTTVLDSRAPLCGFRDTSRCWIDEPFGVVVTAKTWELLASATGVPVMPKGSMLPQGSAERRTGVPRCRDHRVRPVVRSRPYIVLFSVAAITMPATTSGLACTGPSSWAFQAEDSRPTAGTAGLRPECALSYW